MTDPWSSVLPSVVTSAITTVVTLGIAWAVNRAGKKRQARKEPLLLKRGASHLEVLNRTKKPLVGVSWWVELAEGVLQVLPDGSQYMNNVLDVGTGPSSGVLHPGVPDSLGPVPDGAMVHVSFMVNKLRGQPDYKMYSVRVKKDVDEMVMTQDAYPGH